MMVKNKIITASVLLLTAGAAFANQENIGLMGRVKNPSTSDLFASGIYAAKDTFGMRANAVVLAARANAPDNNAYPVNGFNYTKALSRYGSRDSVGLYADNSSIPFKTWERISSASYTPTSVTSSDIDASKVKVGMIMDTDSNPSWSGYVVSVNGNKIITNGWVNNSTKRMGTPPQKTGLIINPATKVWATNFNIFLNEGGRAKAGVIQENGLINNSVNNPNELNGLDTVILPGSKFGGTAAYLSRSARNGNKQQWLIGFASQGAKNANFYSTDASPDKSTNTGYMENSSAVSGLVFSGKNKVSSVEWRKDGKVTARISPDGKLMKVVYSTKLVNDSTNISDAYFKYIINTNKNISLTLPSSKNIIDGYTVEIDNFSGNKITFSSDAKINISKNESSSMHATFAGGEWFVM